MSVAKQESEATFWLVARAAALLYGFMRLGQYWSLVSYAGVPRTGALMFDALLQTYGWLPSFVAGLLARRRALLLAVFTVLVGDILGAMLRGYLTPTIIIDDWDPAIVDLTQFALAVGAAVVSALAGQLLGARRAV